MFKTHVFPAFVVALFLLGAIGRTHAADTTYVRFNTTLGSMDVQLLSDEAPNTVANFLAYVDSGAYYSSFFHRAQTGVFFQGGSYNIRNLTFEAIPTNAPIANEFSVSNTRGTLAMGLVGSDINSATSGWFFNDIDNSAGFDPGSYTVFGMVANTASLAVMDALAAVPVPSPSPFSSPFDQIPLINYVAPNVTLNNIVFVNSIVRETAPVAATVTLSNLAATSNGAAQGVTVTTNPPGLGVIVTYNSVSAPTAVPSLTAPLAVGSYNVIASITSAGFTGSATGTFVISAAVTKTKAKVTLTPGSLKAVFDGNPHAAVATTVPPGLGVTFTYNGQTTVPTTGGSYTVVATINDATHSGSAKGTLVISKIAASVVVNNLSLTYNASTQSATATTTPPGLPVNFTYNGKTTATNAGTYRVVATINDPSYVGSATGTLTITKATPTITLGNLNFNYNGLAHPATATTTPSGLTVTFTYNGKPTVPVNLGSYAVVATLTNPNYVTTTANGTLVIGLEPATAFVGSTGAEVSEGVLPNGVATTVYFEYSTDGTYATFQQTTEQNIGSKMVPVNIYALLSGLTPDTLYHYRLVTVTAAGTVNGPDQTFTTLGFDTALVAKKGDFAVGSSGPTFASFGNPAVNVNNDVAFAGILTLATGTVTAANDIGIWTDHSGTRQLIAQIGSAAPGTAGSFLTLGDPVFNNNTSGAVAFKGTLKVVASQATAATATGIWKGDTSVDLALVARQGGTAPGTSGGTFAAFTSLGLTDSGGAVILATLNASKTPAITAANNIGIWEGNSTADLHLVLRLGQVVGGKTITKLTFLPTETCVNGQTRGFASTSGDIVCGATFSDRTNGIVTVVGGTAQIAAQSGSLVESGFSATFASFSSPAINNNDHTAFVATMTPGVGGITTANNLLVCADDITGTRQFIVESGSGAAPGTTANFLTFGDPVDNNNDAIAFRATLKVAPGQATTTTATGIWCNSTGSLALVAQQGSQAPGCPTGATFSTFPELALPDTGGTVNQGGVIFLATLNVGSVAAVTTANNLGIWAVDATGTLQLIVRTGDVLNVGTTLLPNNKTVTGLAFLPAETTVNGQGRSFAQGNGDLVYLATFSDGSTAIFNVVFP